MKTQLIVLTFFCGFGSLVYAQQPAELVVRNAKVLTMNANRPFAEGFAVTDSRFSFVGSNDELDAHVGSDTRVIDLAGAVVLLVSSMPTSTACRCIQKGTACTRSI